MKTAPLIAIEGIDGSGKGTQAALLLKALRRARKKVVPFSFPAYDKTLSGRLIGQYLNGDLGAPKAIDSRLTAVLFALDRFERKVALEKALSSGAIALCDRYVGSNLAHQVARAKEVDRPAVRALINDLEYRVLGLPKPALVLYLDMPEALAQERVKQKAARSYTNQQLDVQEADQEHLRLALHEYRLASKGRGWVRISTVDRRGDARSQEDIHEEILGVLAKKRVL